MKPKRLPGRPCKGDEPRSVIYRVRLSPSEAEAIKTLNVNLATLLRSIAAGVIEEQKNTTHLRRAS